MVRYIGSNLNYNRLDDSGVDVLWRLKVISWILVLISYLMFHFVILMKLTEITTMQKYLINNNEEIFHLINQTTIKT